jgi:hypothetical protein
MYAPGSCVLYMVHRNIIKHRVQMNKLMILSWEKVINENVSEYCI